MLINSLNMDPNDSNLPPGTSHLFLLRVWWLEKADPKDQSSWLGRLQDPVSGQTREFRGWHGLRRAIFEMMAIDFFSGEENDEDIFGLSA